MAKSSTQIQENSQKRSTAGLFITPVIQFDLRHFGIFGVRDGLSGEVKQEYPQKNKGRQAVAEATAKQAIAAPSAEPRKVQELRSRQLMRIITAGFKLVLFLLKQKRHNQMAARREWLYQPLE